MNALQGGPNDTGLHPRAICDLNEYWGEVWEARRSGSFFFKVWISFFFFYSCFPFFQVRQLYAPFESGMTSGSSDVYLTEMPGGQYTNLLFQSNCLGLEVCILSSQ